MEYNGLSLADLEKLYTQQTKIYNDSGGTNLSLYDELVEMSQLIEEKKQKLKLGAPEQITKVRCEICNKSFENIPDVLKAHEEYHKTWVKFKPIKTRQLDQVEQNIKPQIIEATLEEPTSEQKPEKTHDQAIIEELKKASKQEEEFLKELVNEIKKPSAKAIQVKQKMEEKVVVFKEEKPKRSFFAKKPKKEKPPKESKSFGFPKRRYKRPSFALKGHFPIMEVLLGGGPIIIMKNADRSLEVMKAKKIAGKFIETDIGIFEIDGEYEHRFNKVASFYVFNVHNSKPLSLTALESIQQYYKNKETSIIVNELAKIKTAVEKEKDPLSSMASVFKEENAVIDDQTKKFLVEYLTFDKDDIKLLIQNRRKTKHPKLSQTRPISTIFPTLILGCITTAVLLVMRFFNPIKYFNIPLDIFRLGFSFFGGF